MTDSRLIPFEAYNLFYRGERLETTRQIQAAIGAATELRRRWPGNP